MGNAAKPVIFLSPLSRDNSLSKQLSDHTGDTFGVLSFYSEHLGPDQPCTSSGTLVHRKSGQRFFVPIRAYEGQSNDLETLFELVRIERFQGGVGGYQWGDTRGPDGNYGREKLDALIKMGLAERTGGNRPSGLGGAWPEVRVTQLGREIIEAYQSWLKTHAPAADNDRMPASH